MLPDHDPAQICGSTLEVWQSLIHPDDLAVYGTLDEIANAAE